MLSGCSFWLAFVFSINSLILSGFPLTSFHLANKASYLLLHGFILLLCSCPKMSKMSFIHNYSHFRYSFCNQCFIWTTSKCEQTMEQQAHHACEQTKSKWKQNQVTSHSNWSHVLLFNFAQKQHNSITKGWVHCLMS